MKRTPVLVPLVILTFGVLVLFSAVFNFPRMLDSYAAIETARAHQVAAEAMQTQAEATKFAISGMLCLTAVIGVMVIGGGLLAASGWLNYGRNPADDLLALPYPTQPSARRLRPAARSIHQPPAPPTVWMPTDDFDWQSWTWSEDDFPEY